MSGKLFASFKPIFHVFLLQFAFIFWKKTIFDLLCFTIRTYTTIPFSALVLILSTFRDSSSSIKKSQPLIGTFMPNDAEIIIHSTGLGFHFAGSSGKFLFCVVSGRLRDK